jgi:hypothetical protein
MSNKSNRGEIELPQRPKYRNLAHVAKSVLVVPYLIEGDPALGLFHEDNFVVALGPLKYRSYLNYENIYGETLKDIVSRILWTLSTIYSSTKELAEAETEETQEASIKKLAELID